MLLLLLKTVQAFLSQKKTIFTQPRSQGLLSWLGGGTGKDPGIGRSRVHLTPKITMAEKLSVLFDLDLLLIVVFRRFK